MIAFYSQAVVRTQKEFFSEVMSMQLLAHMSEEDGVQVSAQQMRPPSVSARVV